MVLNTQIMQIPNVVRAAQEFSDSMISFCVLRNFLARITDISGVVTDERRLRSSG